jgi:hypothetical protein
MLEEVLEDLLSTRFAIATISGRHFDVHPILLKEYDNKLSGQIEFAEALAALYNKLVEHVQNHPFKIDIDKIKQAADHSSEARVDWFISAVKSEMRAGVAIAERARDTCTAFFRNV